MNHLEEHKRTVMCSSSFKGQYFKCKTRMSRKTVHQIFSKASNSNWGTCLFCCIQTFATSILLNIFPPTCFSVFHDSIAPSTRTNVISMWAFKKSQYDKLKWPEVISLILALKLTEWLEFPVVTYLDLSFTAMIDEPKQDVRAVFKHPQNPEASSVPVCRSCTSFLFLDFCWLSAFLHLTPPLLCCLNIHRLQSTTKLMPWIFHFSKPIRQ